MEQRTSFSTSLLATFLLIVGVGCATCDHDPPISSNHSCAKGAFFFQPFGNGIADWHLDETTSELWEWVEDGRAQSTSIAELAPNWGDRTSIQSCSQGGAMVFNGDGYNDEEGVKQLFTSRLTSPIIDCSEKNKVYLRFHQYFRKYQEATTKVAISNDGGTTWTVLAIDFNDQLPSNMETGRRDVRVMDISQYAGEFKRVCIRFEVEMSHYFWLIDDVGLFDFEPIFPLETNPAYVGKTLTDLGYDFDVDEDGAPFVPNELIVQFADSVSEAKKQLIRDTMGVVSVDSCVCNKLELWTFGGQMIINGDTISPNQWSIDILEKDKSLTAHEEKGTIQGTNPNFYTHNNEMLPNTNTVDMGPLVNYPSFVIGAPTFNTKVIAVLDTGVDYENANIQPFIALKINEGDGDIPDSIDADNNCFIDDFIGWNFVEDNNNPQDNHSHGTHVTGTIIETIQNDTNCIPPCDFRILPVRTHNEHGIGTLFNALCGMYYALQENATIINASWGFPGKEPAKILVNVIDTARLVHAALIVAAAGNDTLGMGGNNIKRFPACVDAVNVISVASVTIDSSYNYSLSDFSNFSSTLVTVGAEGNNVISDMPKFLNIPSNRTDKSGTSMATPKVSGAAFLHQCQGTKGATNLKNAIETAAAIKNPLKQEIINGKVLKEKVCQ